MLDIATGSDEIRGGVGMVYGNHLLNQNRTCIQVIGHQMSRGPNDLHTALEGLMVGLGSHKGRKEGMVNIDDPRRVSAHKIRR